MTNKKLTYFTVSICVFLGIIFFMSNIQGRTVITKRDTTITPIPRIGLDTTINVNGKTALFIGDSHTCNKNSGWQLLVCRETGMKMINPSVSGKTTYWMLNMAVYKMTDNIDYCFVYGGANDMYTSSITIDEAIANISGIAKICNGHGVKCVVLTGFDPIKCTRTPNPNYAAKYDKFQKKLLKDGIKFAQVIDTRVITRQDCWDGLCHMAPSGHRKIANKVISDLKLKKK